TRLMTVALIEKNDKKAQALLDDAQKKIGDTAAMRLAWVQYWLGKNSPETQPALTKLAEGIDRFSAEEQVRLLGTLGDGLFRVGAKKEAEQLWDRLARQSPHELRIREVLLDLAFDNRDEGRMQQLITEIKA